MVRNVCVFKQVICISRTMNGCWCWTRSGRLVQLVSSFFRKWTISNNRINSDRYFCIQLCDSETIICSTHVLGICSGKIEVTVTFGMCVYDVWCVCVCGVTWLQFQFHYQFPFSFCLYFNAVNFCFLGFGC